jgi:predicted DNA-binding transcriptional regulator YafY
LRTLNRDLALLRLQGLPIDSDRGRGGGVRLDRSWSLGRLHLNEGEAIDLLVSLAIAEKMNSPLLLGYLPGLRRKIVASFGEQYQSRIRQLRQRVLVGPPASAAVLASYVPPGKARLSAIGKGFFELRCLSIDYVDGQGKRTVRDIEPQFLCYAVPVWYLLAYDRLRHGIRHFRIDRIQTAYVLPEKFKPSKPEPYLVDFESGVHGI